jgi:hypothetical protein
MIIFGKKDMSENEINILTINSKILNIFKDDINRLPEYNNKLENIDKSLKTNTKPKILSILQKNKEELIKYINDLENNTSLNFYIAESAELLEKYKVILNAPMKMNFLGKIAKTNKEKQSIINEYLQIANKYVDIEMEMEIKSKKDKIVCKNCNNKEFDILEGNIYVCIICSAQQKIMKNIQSYRDIDRINISSKYVYDRRIHFRDCINQYQGKQNSTVKQEVYDNIEKTLELHHLLVGDIDTPKNIRFQKIQKTHVNMFLKELDYTKHYENLNLIYHNLTGNKLNDISHLEEKLIEDFDILTSIYDKEYKDIDRKNFINTQYVLYQLLLKHKYSCSIEDFTILKTIDRKAFHDEVLSNLFGILGWNFVPLLG